MSKKKLSNPLSKPLAILSMATLVITGIVVSFDPSIWLMAYLIWGWVLCFGLLVIWTLFSLRYGVTTAVGNLGKLHAVHRSKEPKLFFFLTGFYLILGSIGFVSTVFTLLSAN